jgi:hypothetical protein
MILQEILNKKITDFEVDEDIDYLDVTAKIGNREIRFYADSPKMKIDNKQIVEIEFSEQRPGAKSTYELTRSGNEFQVFAFIKQAIEMMLKKWNPDVIKFTADKADQSNRSGVYEKLVKKYLKGYELTKNDDGSRQVKFWLEKR